MGKVSKNARTDRGKNSAGKDMVKVIKAFKSPKSGSYGFTEKVIHKDRVKEFLKEN